MSKKRLFAMFLQENKTAGRMSMKSREVFPFVDALIVYVDISLWLISSVYLSCITYDRRSYLIDSLV